jgi:aminopeptidase N
MSDIRSRIEKRARKAIIQYAFFRWENAVIIGMVLLLMFFLPQPFAGWPIWGWPALGLLGVAAIVYSSLTDMEANAKVQLDLFQERFNPRKVRDPELRREVEKALEYQRRIESYISKQRAGVLRDRLEDTAGQLADWVSHIYALALRLDAYRHDPLLAQERATAPKELEVLVSRQSLEKNTAVKQQLEAVIDSKRKQMESLAALNSRMQKAELQLEQSNTSLATVYSQTQLISAQDIESGRSDRLRQDIQEQIARLNDLVSSLNEVYDYQGPGIG